MELVSLASPALADGFFATVPLGKPTTAYLSVKRESKRPEFSSRDEENYPL